MKSSRRGQLLAMVLVSTGLAGVAHAHFALDAPPAYSVQDGLGLPEKSPPCGQDDPGMPLVPTHAVSTFHAGDTITVTVEEKIFHPGHYRVALAQDQASLPADPAVTAGDSPCGTAEIQTSATPGVIIDNQFPHTTAISGPQSFQVTLPSTPCENCTLQVVEFMSDHGFNNPGGCFYHHCAQVNLVAPGTAISDAGVGTGDAGTPPGGSGGCEAGASGGAVAMVLALCALVVTRRRA